MNNEGYKKCFIFVICIWIRIKLMLSLLTSISSLMNKDVFFYLIRRLISIINLSNKFLWEVWILEQLVYQSSALQVTFEWKILQILVPLDLKRLSVFLMLRIWLNPLFVSSQINNEKNPVEWRLSTSLAHTLVCCVKTICINVSFLCYWVPWLNICAGLCFNNHCRISS